MRRLRNNLNPPTKKPPLPYGRGGFFMVFHGLPGNTESVGASLLAMVVNDDTYGLVHRGGFESIVGTPPADKLAPTVDRVNVEIEVIFKSKKVPKKKRLHRHKARVARRPLWRAGWPGRTKVKCLDSSRCLKFQVSTFHKTWTPVSMKISSRQYQLILVGIFRAHAFDSEKYSQRLVFVCFRRCDIG